LFRYDFATHCPIAIAQNFKSGRWGSYHMMPSTLKSHWYNF